MSVVRLTPPQRCHLGLKVKRKPFQYFGAKLTGIVSPAGQQNDNWRLRFVFQMFRAVMEELVQRSAAFSVFAHLMSFFNHQQMTYAYMHILKCANKRFSVPSVFHQCSIYQY